MGMKLPLAIRKVNSEDNGVFFAADSCTKIKLKLDKDALKQGQLFSRPFIL